MSLRQLSQLSLMLRQSVLSQLSTAPPAQSARTLLLCPAFATNTRSSNSTSSSSSSSSNSSSNSNSNGSQSATYYPRHEGAVPLPSTQHPLDNHAHPSPASTEAASSSPLSFRDFKAVFQDSSISELVRSWVVFRMCGVGAFVRNAETLLALSNRVLGTAATNFVIKHSFFNHFCGGETPEDVWVTMQRLHRRGVCAILDYAAEDDVGAAAKKTRQQQQQQQQHQQDSATPAAAAAPPAAAAGATAADQRKVVARTYSYDSELQCDRHVATFMKAIDTAASLPGQGFAAVKLTALGNPALLERISNCILTVRGLFQRFDTDGSGCIDRQEFIAAHKQVFPDASAEDRARTFSHYDRQAQGLVDYVAWCQGLSLRQMPAIAESIHRAYGDQELQGAGGKGWLGDLSASCLTQEECELLLAMKARLEKIVERAVSKDVKLMIDAEHTYFQPAIDHLTLQFMKQYNVGGKSYILNTYQAYLITCPKRLADDMERAHREGYRFAAKLVRGAYLNLERSRAKDKGYPSPVWDTLEETHASYETCLRLVMREVAAGRAEVMLGSHNEGSVQQAVQLMQQYGLVPGRAPVYFGQLLGMADHLTFTLGSHGYPAFKYVPYGMVHEVVPYLLRRAQENASIMKGTKADMQLLQAEIARRLGWSRASARA